MGYLSLLTLLCLSLLLVMSSEGMHHMRKHVNPIMQRFFGAKKCVIIKPLGKLGAALQKATPVDPDGWTVKRVSCKPTTKGMGLSEDCYSKIRKGIDLLVFDVFDVEELHEIQRNLAIAEIPLIDFFVRYKGRSNQPSGLSTIRTEVKLLDIEKIINKTYSQRYIGKFVEFSREGKEKVSYYGNINWQIKKETDLKYKKKEGDTKYTTLHSFVGTISKTSFPLILSPQGHDKDHSLITKDLQIPENTEGTFKPIEGQTTIPCDFEHNFTKTNKELQITLKDNNYWVADI